jgi:hypothetical protein
MDDDAIRYRTRVVGNGHLHRSGADPIESPQDECGTVRHQRIRTTGEDSRQELGFPIQRSAVDLIHAGVDSLPEPAADSTLDDVLVAAHVKDLISRDQKSLTTCGFPDVLVEVPHPSTMSPRPDRSLPMDV